MARRKIPEALEFKVKELPLEATHASRDMDQVDAIFKRVFKSPPATRKDFAPVGFMNKVRWVAGKVFLKEATL